VSGEDPIVAGMAGRYAKALFELADEAGALSEVENDLGSLKAMLETSEDLTRLVRSPVFGLDQQSRAMSAVMEKAGLSVLTRNFVGVVAKNRRLFSLVDMISAFAGLLARHRGEVSAHVTSAQDLDTNQIEKLKATLKEAVGRDVKLTTKVDESLIGGLVVKVGSRMIDTSIATKLNNIKLAMKEA
jgi:F-type H+-transporting ATPase subunit delta